MFFSLGRRLLAGRDGIRLTEQLVGEGLDHLERLARLTDPLLCLSKANEELTRLLSQLKVSLYGDAGKPLRPVVLLADAQLPLLLELNCPPPLLSTENDASPEVVAQLAQEMYMHDVLLLLVERIGAFEFEVRPSNPSLPARRFLLTRLSLCFLSQAKKDVTQIFNHLLRRQIGSRFPTVEYITKKPQVVFATLKG